MKHHVYFRGSDESCSQRVYVRRRIRMINVYCRSLRTNERNVFWTFDFFSSVSFHFVHITPGVLIRYIEYTTVYSKFPLYLRISAWSIYMIFSRLFPINIHTYIQCNRSDLIKKKKKKIHWQHTVTFYILFIGIIM